MPDFKTTQTPGLLLLLGDQGLRAGRVIRLVILPIYAAAVCG